MDKIIDPDGTITPSFRAAYTSVTINKKKNLQVASVNLSLY